MTATPALTPGFLVTAILRAHSRLGGAIEPLTDAHVRAPSLLPDWSRGHVLAHISGIGAAAARQLEYARRGEQVDVYDGGRPARDAAIEAAAPAPAADHVHAVHRATERVEQALTALAPADWSRPVRYRDGVVRDMALAWWREIEIHTTDLDLGLDAAGWSGVLCEHLTDFLAERVPAGTRLVLASPDGWERVLGAGATPVVVRGSRTDLVAWLAGRKSPQPVRADDGAQLPILDPWPSPGPISPVKTRRPIS